MSQAKNIFLFFVTEVDKSSSNLLMRRFHFWIVFDVRWGDPTTHRLPSRSYEGQAVPCVQPTLIRAF